MLSSPICLVAILLDSAGLDHFAITPASSAKTLKYCAISDIITILLNQDFKNLCLAFFVLADKILPCFLSAFCFN